VERSPRRRRDLGRLQPWDVIKSIIADALGMHLDQFQRIVVDPCSVSVIRYTDTRPYVLRTNDVGGDLSAFVPGPAKGRRRRRTDATVGAVPEPERSEARPTRMVIMPRQIFHFERPSRFIAGTVGAPGGRSFFLQAVDGNRVVSVALEKQQVEVLADRLSSYSTRW